MQIHCVVDEQKATWLEIDFCVSSAVQKFWLTLYLKPLHYKSIFNA